MKDHSRLLLRLAMLCLFLSGMAGLIYEIVWARYLALFLGHASYAIIAVLVAFMGGLALGNVVIGRWADRTRRPLASYAWVEIAIGLYALLFPFYYEVCYDWYLILARQVTPGSPVLLVLKFVFSTLAILIPTMLMGGTLPLLTRLLTRSLGEMKERVAALYFINSAGGVVGIWLADFWWIEAIGLESTIWAGAVLNLVVGGGALLASGWMKEGRAEDRAAAPVATASTGGPAAEPVEIESAGTLRLAMVAIGLSGFVAMLYQVAWTRLLALALGSSTHAFGLMLITFIVGLTVGAGVVYRWRTPRRTLWVFAWAELALAFTVGLSLYFYEYLPYWFFALANLLARRAEAYGVYQLLQGAICFVVMFLPTVFLGMTLPLVTRAATPSLDRAGRSVGQVFAVNTIGTVLGAALTGLVLLPALGLARTFVLGVVVNCLIGLAMLWRVEDGKRWRVTLACTGAFLVVLLGTSGALDRVWRGAFTFGAWRLAEFASSAREFHTLAKNAPVVYYRDGAGATVSIHSGTNLSGGTFLKVNGKTDAGTGIDMTTQLLLGHLPLLMHPAATNTLVVGLGGGMTAGAVAAHTAVRQIDVVEISPEVVEAARYFDAHNGQVLRDPRLRIIVDDAKSFLLLTDQKYDVIISEPSNPWVAGVAGVFSLEYYQSCLAHLAPNGVMVQWMQLYEITDGGWDMVLATFKQVFPYVSVWHTEGADILLVGSPTPRPTDLAGFAARFADPAVNADLARVRLANLPVLLSLEMISAENGAALPPGDTRVHSDFYPTLEYRAQRDFFVRQGATRFRQADENFSRRPGTMLGQYLRTHPLSQQDYEAFAHNYLNTQKPFLDLLGSILLRWQRDFPQDWRPLEIASRLVLIKAPGELDVLRLAPKRRALLERAREDPTLLRQYGVALMRTYTEQRSCFYAPTTEELTEVLKRLIELDADNQRVYQAYLAELAWDRGDDEACLDLGRRAMLADLPRGAAKFKLDPIAPLRAVALLADVLARRGELQLAVQMCDQAAEGYLTPAARNGSLFFEVTHRKLGAEWARRTGAAPR